MLSDATELYPENDVATEKVIQEVPYSKTLTTGRKEIGKSVEGIDPNAISEEEDTGDEESSVCKDNVTMESIQVCVDMLDHLHDCPVDWSAVDIIPKTDLYSAFLCTVCNYVQPDLFVRLGNHHFSCHLLVLQTYSLHFSECKQNMTIYLDETKICPETFAIIYDWMLQHADNEERLLTRRNILDVLASSQYLEIMDLEEQCWAFIDSHEVFSEETALLLFFDAMQRRIYIIAELMLPRITRVFLDLVNSDDFYDLPLDVVCRLLKSNFISVREEKDIFFAGVKWLAYDWEQRKSNVKDIMECIRFSFMQPFDLVDLARGQQSDEILRITKMPEILEMIKYSGEIAVIRCTFENDPEKLKSQLKNLGLEEPEKRNWISSNDESINGFMVETRNRRKSQKLCYTAEIDNHFDCPVVLPNYNNLPPNSSNNITLENQHFLKCCNEGSSSNYIFLERNITPKINTTEGNNITAPDSDLYYNNENENLNNENLKKIETNVNKEPKEFHNEINCGNSMCDNVNLIKSELSSYNYNNIIKTNNCFCGMDTNKEIIGDIGSEQCQINTEQSDFIHNKKWYGEVEKSEGDYRQTVTVSSRRLGKYITIEAEPKTRTFESLSPIGKTRYKIDVPARLQSRSGMLAQTTAPNHQNIILIRVSPSPRTRTGVGLPRTPKIRNILGLPSSPRTRSIIGLSYSRARYVSGVPSASKHCANSSAQTILTSRDIFNKCTDEELQAEPLTPEYANFTRQTNISN